MMVRHGDTKAWPGTAARKVAASRITCMYRAGLAVLPILIPIPACDLPVIAYMNVVEAMAIRWSWYPDSENGNFLKLLSAKGTCMVA